MVKCLVVAVALVGIVGPSVSSRAPAVVVVQDAPLPKDASLDVVLEALHQRGLNLTDFDADVSMSESDAEDGSVKVRAGRVLYHKVGGEGGTTSMRVKFETRDGASYVKEYALVGDWFTERDYKTRRETRRQVLRPGEKINLLKLGEGPFPLPIGQEPTEVKRQFNVTLLEPENGVPRAQLVPIEGTKLAKKFSEIIVAVDPVTRFPTVIKTTDRTKTTVKTTSLTNIRVNPRPGLTEGDFALPKIGSDWDTTEEPLGD